MTYGRRSSERQDGVMQLMFYAVIAVVCIGIFFAGNCGSPDPKLKQSLEKQGFTKVSVGDWSAFECSSGDSISRAFTAVNSNGQQVDGTICCGFFLKGCTVRF